MEFPSLLLSLFLFVIEQEIRLWKSQPARQPTRVKQNTSEHVTCSHTAAYTQRVTDARNYATGTSECTNLAILIKPNFQTQKSIHSFRSPAHNRQSPYNNNNKIGAAGLFSSSQVQQPATLSLQLRPMHTLLCNSSCSLWLLQSTWFEHATTEVHENRGTFSFCEGDSTINGIFWIIIIVFLFLLQLSI
jgi:hypothetical protein